MRLSAVGCLVSAGLFATLAGGEQKSPRQIEQGTVRFQPAGDQREIPERYRLSKWRSVNGAAFFVFGLKP